MQFAFLLSQVETAVVGGFFHGFRACKIAKNRRKASEVLCCRWALLSWNLTRKRIFNVKALAGEEIGEREILLKQK